MACYAPWIFLDDAGSAWALGVNTIGQLTFSKVSPVPGNAMLSVPLKDITLGSVYAAFVTYNNGPFIDTKGPVSVPAVGDHIPLSAVGRDFWLQVSNGRLIGMWKGLPPTDPQVGQLYNYDMVNPPIIPPNTPNAGLRSPEPGGWLPVYKQPGGIGTLSLPAQQAGSTSIITGVPFEIGMGMNTAGCGHWFNNFEEIQASVACQTAMLIRCPLCGYLVEIISPVDLAYTANYEHISS